MQRATFALSVLGLAGAAACSKPHALPESAPSASSSAVASSSVIAAATAPHAARAKPGCRALAVTGTATVSGSPLGTGALLEGEQWVDLSAGSSLSLRHTATSREFKLVGPARALPCRNGREQLLLARGQLSTSANLGVRPGAEVLIATPLGAIHYGDAALDVEFGSQGLRMRVKQGEAWLEPEARGKPPFKNPVRTGEARLPPHAVDAPALTETCRSAAQSARDSGERVLGTPGVGAIATLGVRAAAHMRDRAAARTACAVAAAALGASSNSALISRLSAVIAQADELWQSVPRGVSGQKN